MKTNKIALFTVGQTAWLVSTDHQHEGVREVQITACTDADHVAAYMGMQDKPPFVYEARCQGNGNIIVRTHIFEGSLKQSFADACIALVEYNEAERKRIDTVIATIRKEAAGNGNAGTKEKGGEDEA